MTRSFLFRTCSFMVLIPTIWNHSHAQITVATVQDQQPNTGIVLAPVSGPAQIGVVSTRGGFAPGRRYAQAMRPWSARPS